MWCDQENLDIVQLYLPEAGSFGKIGTAYWDTSKRLRVLCWYTCREEFLGGTFGNSWDNEGKADRGCFLFALGRSFRAASVVAFISKIEGRLGVVPRTKFGPTRKKDVIWLRPSPWWSKNEARRSLFTAFLRAGCYYRPRTDNFDKALDSRIYTRNTRQAVERFLNGHTDFSKRGMFVGWQATFEGRSERAIQRMLIKPRGKSDVARKRKGPDNKSS